MHGCRVEMCDRCRMNRWKRHELYCRHFNLTSATDNVDELLREICMRNNVVVNRVLFLGRQMVPDMKRAAEMFIRAFHESKFGNQFLDDDILLTQ